MGPFETIPDHGFPHWTLQTMLDNMGQCTTCTWNAPYKILWDQTWPYGTLWDPLGPFGTLWDQTKPYKTLRNHAGPWETVWDCTEPYWPIRNHTGPYWAIWDHATRNSHCNSNIELWLMLITFITFILLNLALEYIGPYSLAVKGALSHHQQRRTNSTIQNQPGSQNWHSDQLLQFFDSSSHFIRRGYACTLSDS